MKDFSRFSENYGLLNGAQLNIKDIAYKCGYKNDSTFRRAFMEIEKCPPSEYRKRYIAHP